MKNFILKLTLVGAALSGTALHAAPIPGRGTWETTLQARDINGDGTADAYYDTLLNITWLANAMGTLGTPFDDALPGNGESTWNAARSWASSLNVHGVTGWRLPRFLTGNDASEVSHMHCTTLGNFATQCNGGPIPRNYVNSGPFLNLSSNVIWLDEPYPELGPPPHAWAWYGDAVSGYHAAEPTTADFTAWAVRNGDVPIAAIPEPGTWALMLLGLGAAGLHRRAAAGRP